MRAILEGEVSQSDAEDTVECLLRTIGLDEEEALALSRRKLPAYVSQMIEEHKRSVMTSLPPL